MIRRETRKNILDHYDMEGISFNGRMDDLSFLDRLYPLADMASNDSRFNNARDDIIQHTLNNNDYQGNWVFSDQRFSLLDGADEIFLRFICEMAHPLVRLDSGEAKNIIKIASDWLANDEWELFPKQQIAGGTIVGFRLKNAQQPPSEEEVEHIWAHGKLRLFISHKDKHKKAVQKLAEELLDHGISGFVAHEQIPEQSYWRKEILLGLRSMEACLCYITEDFFDSVWTNQEIGFAMAKGVPVYLYCAEKKDPEGFLSEIQAIKSGLQGLLVSIKNDFSNNENFKRPYIDRLMEARDGSFDNAKNRFFDLVGLKFNDAEIEELISAVSPATGNRESVNKLNAILQDHIKDEHKSHPLLRRLVTYREYLERDIVARHTTKNFVFEKIEAQSWGYNVIERKKSF